MIARVPVKCLSVFIVVFLMCPKRSRLSVPIANQQEYYHAVRRCAWMHGEAEPEAIAGEGVLKEYEPGFDLTDVEIAKFKLWDKGVVPYYIDVPSFTDKGLRDRIRWFLNMVSSTTSLNFVELPRPPTDDQTRWVFFVNRRGQLGCADHSVLNFTTQGVQRVILGYDCMAIGGELAETVLAIAGVPAQHNAPDRDKYIKIFEDNIMPEKKYLFKKLKNDEWLFHDIEYDFMSASHFHYHKHSVNGRATIATKSPSQRINLDKRGFSAKDILKIKMLYNYIVKTKKSKHKVSACSKLFSKGKKFKKFAPDAKKEEPRPKPKKYVGEAGDNDDKDEGTDEGGSSIEDEEKTKETKSNTNGTTKETPGSRTHNHEQSNKGLLNNPQKVHYYKDPLTYLSDYETGDENYQRSVLKKSDYKGFGKITEYWKKKLK